MIAIGLRGNVAATRSFKNGPKDRTAGDKEVRYVLLTIRIAHALADEATCVFSCKFCYRRKLKCDKQYPCSRCVSRGLGELCEQETVVVNGRLVGGALTADRNKRWVPTVAELMEENKALHRKITSQEKMMQSMGHSPGHGTHDPTNSSISRSRRGRTEDREQDGYSRRSTSRASTAQTEDEMEIADSKDSEEDLAPIRQVFGLTDQEVVAGQQPLHLFTQPSAQTIQSLRSLVPQRQSGDLVRFHCKYLHWIHGVFHIPSFLRDHDIWVADLALGRGDEEPYDYFALYFAIIACSLHFMSEEEAMSLGYSIETLEMLPRFWFDTSLNCLQLCGFMLNPTLRVLQTICILPTIAHAFDRSMYLASMMHSALGLARDLKIHLLRDESSSKRFGGPIRSQIARRIWWCLMIADSLTPGAQHPFHLVYPAAWTTAPANLNDADLLDGQPIVPRPLGQVTCVSHLLLMGRVANIFRDYCHSFSNDQSVKSILRNVKQFDDQLLHVHQDLPELKPVPGETYKLEYDEHGGFVWHSWSRYLWLSAIPGMRIQLWRYCLDRSYKDERFAEARSICLAASRDLITAAKTPVPSIFRKNWHVFSYTVMAGTILGTELVRRPDRTSLESLEAEVLDVLQLLKQESRPNAMVNRGIDILENMLDVYRSTSPRHSQNADALPYPEELFQPDIADPWGLYGTDATMPDLFYPIFDPSAWPLGDLDVQNFEGAGTSSG